MIVAYYGDGKGKTTAALGVALRALGRGLRVVVLQFIKGDPLSGASAEEGAVKWASGENLLNSRIKISPDKFQIKAVGEGFYKIQGDKLSKARHQQAARAGLNQAKELIFGKAYDLIVLDEIIRAMFEDLVNQKDVFDLIDLANLKNKHLIMTGHQIDKALADKCDLVTEMKKIKHPFDMGILAEEGIDY